MVEICPERPGEAAVIEQIHKLAFGRDTEARLVRRSRVEGYNVISMVAAEGDCVVGHALFSRVFANGSQRLEAVALAPVAVLPDRQGAGIGSAIVQRGLDACSASAVDAALLLGDGCFHVEYPAAFQEI